MYANQNDKAYAYSALTLNISTINLFNYIEPPNAYYHSDQIYTHLQWQQKHEWLNHVISSTLADIIGFQEVFSPNALKACVKAQGYPYFAVVDEPVAINHYTFKKPVVCLASRYPILKATKLVAHQNFSHQLTSRADFEYTRAPLHAVVALPNLGETDVYVVHFKSHRPILEENPHLTTLHQMISSEIIGNSLATQQRMHEAAQLMLAVIERRFQSNNPVILMGDFNDELDTDVLAAFDLTKLRSISQYLSELPITHYLLQNSWQLYHQDKKPKAQPPSHYYQQLGLAFDYILLSNEFNSADINHLAKVSDYVCDDSHLVKIGYPYLTSSDHAVVSISLSLRD